MSRELAVHSRLGVTRSAREDRAIVKQARALERRAIAVRAEDVARRQVASGRMRDIRDLSEDALEAGGEIGDCLAYEAERRPFFARELSDLASTGVRGLKGELRRYVEEG